ncbi:GumC family protein [Pseudorhizobium tarimense]
MDGKNNPGRHASGTLQSDGIPEIEFAYILSVLRNCFLKIGAVAAVFCVASVGLSLLLQNYYTSTTSILVDPEGSRIVESEIDSGTQATEARALNQQFILTSVKVLSAVVKSEGLADDPEFGAAEPYESDAQKRAQRALEALQRSITANLNKASFVVDLSVTTGDPVKSARIANAIAESYIEARIAMNTGVLRQATADLSVQLASLEKAVEDGDRAVQAYKAEHNLVDVAGRPTVEQQISETNTEISRVSASIAENEALISELALARSNPEYLRLTPDSSLTPAIIELRTRYLTALEQQTVLQSSFGDRHPYLRNAVVRTRTIAGLFDKQLEDFAISLTRNGEKLKGQLELLRRDLETLKAGLNETDELMVRLRELERKLASDRSVYETFLLRTRQLAGQEQTLSEHPQVISPAQIPLRKSGPRRSLIVAGGTVLGLLFGCGVALAQGRPSRPPDVADDGIGKRSSGEEFTEGAPTTKRQLWRMFRGMLPGQEPSTTVGPDSHTTRSIGDARLLEAGRTLIRSARGRTNHCVVLFSTQEHDSGPEDAILLASGIALAGEDILLVDAETDANLTRLASATRLPGLLNAISLRRIEGEFIDLFNIKGLSLMPLGQSRPPLAAKTPARVGSLLDLVPKPETLIDWLNDSGDRFDLVIVYAGTVDRYRSIPEVEAASAKFILMCSQSDIREVEPAMSLLTRRGLSPIEPLFTADEQDDVPRAS